MFDDLMKKINEVLESHINIEPNKEIDDELILMRNLRDFLKKNGPLDIISHISPRDYFIASLMCTNFGFSFNDVREAIDTVYPTMKEIESKYSKLQREFIWNLIDAMVAMHKYGYDDMCDLFNKESKYYHNDAQYLRDVNRSTVEDFNFITNVMDAFYGSAKTLLKNDYKEVKSLYDLIKNEQCGDIFLETMQFISYNERKMLTRDDFDFVKPQITGLKTKINKRISRLTAKEDERYAIHQYQANLYTRLKDKLENIDDDEIITKDDITVISDEDVKTAYLLFALAHNEEIYKYLINKKGNSINRLLMDHGVDVSTLSLQEIEILNTVGYEKLVKLLGVLSSNNAILSIVSSHDDMVGIIQNTSEEAITNIISLVNSSLLDVKVINNTPHIIYQASMNLIQRNLNILKSAKLDTKQLSISQPNILLLPDNFVSTNTLLLQQYLGASELRYLDNFDMLADPKLFDSMDMLIENGMYTHMINDFGLISDDTRNVVLRVLIAKELGFDFENDIPRLKPIVKKEEKFPLTNDQLSDAVVLYDSSFINPKYLEVISKSHNNEINPDISKLPIVKKLDNLYQDSPLTFNINNQIISRNKVLRYLTTLHAESASEDEILDMTFNSIIINKVMSDDSVANIQNAIFGISEKNKNYQLQKSDNN